MTTGIAFGTSLVGLECHRVTVRAIGSVELSDFRIHGLSEAAHRETRVRVAAALGSVPCSCEVFLEGLPPGGDTSALDLPIAVAIMRALGRDVNEGPETTFYGELALDGTIRAVRGALCRTPQTGSVLVPRENAWEAGLAGNPDVHWIEKLSGEREPVERSAFAPAPPFDGPELPALRHCQGKPRVLLVGPPGSGKTLVARALAAGLGPLSSDEQLEVARIYGVTGLIGDSPLSAARPFRAPHHTVSLPGLVGGGTRPRPGEVSLAHRGVLLLDELPEFRRSCLNDLAHVLDSKVSRLYRNSELVSFPAEPACVVATANPCPCGYMNHPRRECRCTGQMLGRYMQRLEELIKLFGFTQVFVNVPPVAALVGAT